MDNKCYLVSKFGNILYGLSFYLKIHFITGAKNKIPCKYNESLFVICNVPYAQEEKIIGW